MLSFHHNLSWVVKKVLKPGIFILSGIIVGVLFFFLSCKKTDQPPEIWPPVNDNPTFRFQAINLCAWGKSWWDDAHLVDEAMKFIIEEGSNLVVLDWAVNFDDDGRIIPIELSESLHPPLDRIAEIIRKSHKAGLKVMLKPHVTLKDSPFNRNIFNTDINIFRPENFFPDYKEYLIRLSEFAHNQKVEMFCFGTEMNHVDWLFRNEWVDLISEIRKRYQGPLIYDALFNRVVDIQDIEEVVFWDQVDFIGVSFYVPLTTDDNAPVDTLRAAFFRDLGEIYGYGGWFRIDNVITFLKDISMSHGKPIFIVEGGYPSKNQGLWNFSVPDPQGYAHYDLQYRGLDAYLGVLKENREDWLVGVSLWCIVPYMLKNETLETIWHTQDFNFYRKPAAEVVKMHYNSPSF